MINKGYLSQDFQLRMPGSMGCLLSHVTLWKHVHQLPDCNIALICEDDVVLDPDFIKQLGEIPWMDVPENWDIIKLAYHHLDGKPVSKHVPKPNLILKKGTNSGTFCYLMKSKSGPRLKNILIPYNNINSMDVMLRKNFDKFHPYLLRSQLAHENQY